MTVPRATGRRSRSSPKQQRSRLLPTIGWKEWVALPDLALPAIQAKIDTGARSSSIHATSVTTFEREGRLWARFRFGSGSTRRSGGEWREAPAVGFRRIRSSTGHLQSRLIIATRLTLAGKSWTIEISLADRAEMGFEMLVGRAAIRRKFLVDPGRSHLAGTPRARLKSATSPIGSREEE